MSPPLAACVGERLRAHNAARPWLCSLPPSLPPPPPPLSSCKHLHPSCIVSNRKDNELSSRAGGAKVCGGEVDPANITGNLCPARAAHPKGQRWPQPRSLPSPPCSWCSCCGTRAVGLLCSWELLAACSPAFILEKSFFFFPQVSESCVSPSQVLLGQL